MSVMDEAMYQKAKGLTVILFLIFLMAVLKTANFQAASMTGFITFDMQLNIMGLLLTLTIFAGATALFFRKRFGF